MVLLPLLQMPPDTPLSAFTSRLEQPAPPDTNLPSFPKPPAISAPPMLPTAPGRRLLDGGASVEALRKVLEKQGASAKSSLRMLDSLVSIEVRPQHFPFDPTQVEL